MSISNQPSMITPEKAQDIRRYATALLSVGVNPDNPEEIESSLVIDPEKPPVCSLVLAHIFRKVADALEEQHGEGIC